MASENRTPDEIPRPPADQRGADAGDLVLAALDFLRGGLPGNGGPPGPPPLARQEARLLQWADRLGLLLKPGIIPFDVIPCHPAGGFLAFIQETLAAGHSLHAVRTVTTRQP